MWQAAFTTKQVNLYAYITRTGRVRAQNQRAPGKTTCTIGTIREMVLRVISSRKVQGGFNIALSSAADSSFQQGPRPGDITGASEQDLIACSIKEFSATYSQPCAVQQLVWKGLCHALRHAR